MSALRCVVQMRFSGGMGGAENVAFSLARILSDSVENSVLYLVLEERSGAAECEGLLKRLEEYGVRHRVFRTPSKFSFRLYRELLAALREDGSEIVHAHCYKSAFYSSLLKLAGAGRLKKVVFTLHGLFDPLTVRSALIHTANVIDLVAADRIVGCSREISERYEKLPFLGKKTETIQNCLFTDSRHDLRRIEDRRREMRAAMASLWGLDESAVWVACIGRLTEQKNFPLFLETAGEIIRGGKTGSNAQFLVVGDGPLKDQLWKIARDMGIERHVFFTSYVSDMDMLLNGIDMLMVTSLWEGTPMCVLEAMAYGKPVVSTDVGGIPGVVEHGETGFLVTGFDARALAERALELINDCGKRSLMGEKAHRAVMEEFSPSKWAERHLSMYRKVIGG